MLFSMFSHRSFGPTGMIATAFFWAQRLRRIEKHQNAHIYELRYELRYEDLVNNPELEVKQLCMFLGINFSERMYEDWHQSSWNIHLTLLKEAGQHAKIKHGVDKANTSKYITRMTRIQRLIFELAGGWYLK